MNARVSDSTDFSVANHGSVVILHALTEAARDWVDEHIGDDAMTWGRSGTVVEPRYIADIVEGIRAAGLSVTPARQAHAQQGD